MKRMIFEFWDEHLITSVIAADILSAVTKAMLEADALCDRPLENPQDRRNRIHRASLRGTVVVKTLD